MWPNLREWCMGVPSQKYHFFMRIGKQDGHQRRFFFSDWPIFKRLLLLNYWAKCHQTCRNDAWVVLHKNITFSAFGKTRWPPEAVLFSDWLNFKCLLLLNYLANVLAGMMHGCSFTKTSLFVHIGKTRWPPEAILFSDWLIFKCLHSLLGQMSPILEGMMHGWSFTKTLFVRIGKTRWPPEASSFFWLAEFQMSSLKLLGQMSPNWQEWCMGVPSQKHHFLCGSEKQDGRQRRLFFLIGWISNVFSS